jgi:hypothetical protein
MIDYGDPTLSNTNQTIVSGQFETNLWPPGQYTLSSGITGSANPFTFVPLISSPGIVLSSSNKFFTIQPGTYLFELNLEMFTDTKDCRFILIRGPSSGGTILLDGIPVKFAEGPAEDPTRLWSVKTYSSRWQFDTVTQVHPGVRNDKITDAFSVITNSTSTDPSNVNDSICFLLKITKVA